MLRERLGPLSDEAAHQVMAGGALGFYGMNLGVAALSLEITLRPAIETDTAFCRVRPGAAECCRTDRRCESLKMRVVMDANDQVGFLAFTPGANCRS